MLLTRVVTQLMPLLAGLRCGMHCCNLTCCAAWAAGYASVYPSCDLPLVYLSQLLQLFVASLVDRDACYVVEAGCPGEVCGAYAALGDITGG